VSSPTLAWGPTAADSPLAHWLDVGIAVEDLLLVVT
jgi:hypothetical protein